MWVYVSDRFVPKEEAVISVFDHGFLYGDGVYETLRSYNGRIFMLQAHLDRLRRSAHLIGIEFPERDWPALLHEAMERNKLLDAYLRVTISRGEGEIGLDPASCNRPTVVIVAKPLPSYPAELFQDGIGLAVVSVRRNLAAALSPQIKSLNFLNNIMAKREALQARAFDGLMLNADGHVAESTTSNVFFVKSGRLYTPSVACGILDGITREVILILAREQSVPVEEGCYTPAFLSQADECFLTNTTMEIMPVREIDRTPVGSGKPGDVTTTLHRVFRSTLARFLE
ncbi:MAG TPA: aminotransferase class IV [Nitrospiraceae bacterium]|nr:aminotransferase class IV [Nitrospiraceae bacterium]